MTDRGDKIREARQAKDMSQDDLAKALGVSARSILRWENADLAPADDKLALLRIVLEADL